MKTKLFLSLVSGEIYEICEDETKNLDRLQIPLTGRPKNCRKCYGRGVSGKDVRTDIHVPCSCLHKYVDFSAMKSEEIQFDTAKPDLTSPATDATR